MKTFYIYDLHVTDQNKAKAQIGKLTTNGNSWISSIRAITIEARRIGKTQYPRTQTDWKNELKWFFKIISYY